MKKYLIKVTAINKDSGEVMIWYEGKENTIGNSPHEPIPYERKSDAQRKINRNNNSLLYKKVREENIYIELVSESRWIYVYTILEGL